VAKILSHAQTAAFETVFVAMARYPRPSSDLQEMQMGTEIRSHSGDRAKRKTLGTSRGFSFFPDRLADRIVTKIVTESFARNRNSFRSS
jgi:hypothetical protein